MDESTFTVLIIPGLILLWVGMGYFFAHFSGWNALVKRYPVSLMQTQKRYRFQSLRFGWSRYRNCITFSVGSQGLHISVLRVFLFGHAPILIPWRAIHHIEKGIFSARCTVDGFPREQTMVVPSNVIGDAITAGFLPGKS